MNFIKHLRKIFVYVIFILFSSCYSIPKTSFCFPKRETIKKQKEKTKFFSVEGKEIEYFVFGKGNINIHFHGAIHGDEKEGVGVLRRLMAYLRSRPYLIKGLKLIFIPIINPDGYERNSRFNARGVDLNRNFPAKNWRKLRKARSGTKPLSEPESKAVYELIKTYPPFLVVTLHSARRSVNWDGPCQDLAERMAVWNGYRTEETVGYPTPGSLGSWLGKDLNIPVITLELRHASEEELWKENKYALLEAIKWARMKAFGLP